MVLQDNDVVLMMTMTMMIVLKSLKEMVIFADNMSDDYREDGELDRYDESALDMGDVDEGLDAAARREIDEYLDREDALNRDRRQRDDDGDVVGKFKISYYYYYNKHIFSIYLLNININIILYNRLR